MSTPARGQAVKLDPNHRGACALAIDLPLPGAHLRMQMQVTAAPVPPKRLLPVLRTVADHLVERATIVAAEQGKRPSCHAGCAACCSYLVPVSRAEAYRLLALVQGLPPERQAALRARHQIVKERLAQAGLLEILEHPERTTDQDLALLGDRYFSAAAPCPFLDDDGRCSIYAERPLTCREHLALSPAARCGDKGGAAGDGAGGGDDALRLLSLAAYPSRASNALDDGLPMEQGGWVALPLALEYAASHPEAPPAAPAPELLQRFFAALSAQAEEAVSPAAGDPPR